MTVIGVISTTRQAGGALGAVVTVVATSRDA